jgi:hypothetical protein
VERVAFLVERTGQRIGCMLNPEGLTVERVAGLVRRSPLAGPVNAGRLADDPLLYTGGGRTEMVLDLLFDTSLAGSSPVAEDVRTLTRPLVDLAENSDDTGGRGQPPVVRFVWGKTWNVPGIITAVAERFERFTEHGAPRRSWLRMRFRRVAVPELQSPGAAPSGGLDRLLAAAASQPRGETRRTVELMGGPGAEHSAPARLDEVAWRTYRDASLWRLIAAFNEIEDPFRVAPGTLLRIPPHLPAGGTP